jgi:hypothetical protein
MSFQADLGGRLARAAAVTADARVVLSSRADGWLRLHAGTNAASVHAVVSRVPGRIVRTSLI